MSAWAEEKAKFPQLCSCGCRLADAHVSLGGGDILGCEERVWSSRGRAQAPSLTLQAGDPTLLFFPFFWLSPARPSLRGLPGQCDSEQEPRTDGKRFITVWTTRSAWADFNTMVAGTVAQKGHTVPVT